LDFLLNSFFSKEAKMKLITHNLLTSKILKNVVTGYPLKIVATKTEVKTADYQPEFVNRMMKKIDYKALFGAAKDVNYFFSSKICDKGFSK
jgi:multifunctional methyltransferase subunit TRM112